MFGLSNKSNNNTKEAKDMTLVVKTNRCPQNHPCPSVRVCPVGALLQHGYAAPIVDMDKCIKCGKCTKSCPMRALVLE
jgi:Fe-S-cluster-containing hydrogenase component 2